MTTIFDNGNFWIEYLDIPRATVAAAASRDVTVALEKPGKFVGGSLALSVSVPDVGPAIIKKTDNTKIDYGDELEEIDFLCVNTSGGNKSIGGHVILFLRL